ncbi:hypothetical protein D7X55_23810 [Corallococcus sp. AB049A]|uniref:WD40 repeat domain-containing protein n=1 Tax=Corallococcus interemptor TaxID=2316720 RepID=A0A3A8PZZ6_9BACT|nr:MULTISPECIES: hypothetical protein [Corallococcus]RKH46663.1 hypothetical protein D7Y23_23475 [Corallococcus sp. AB050B]RKH62067.1 hypothetical protein D7X96_30560 [Corallococcus interemptor]RKI60847.1 hypothetical protein D7X55_23810 [Corallococcus sp. AB049A]
MPWIGRPRPGTPWGIPSRRVALTRITTLPVMDAEWAGDGFVLPPSDDALGLAVGARRLAVLGARESWPPGHALELPRTARLVALHPSLRCAAVLGPGRIELVGQALDGSQVATPARAWTRDTQTLGFDITGEGLWTSSVEDGRSCVRVLDTRTLSDVAEAGLELAAPVVGEDDLDGLHEWVPHPRLPVMGVAVSQGQEGTWLTFVERGAAGLVRGAAVASEEAPFYPAGFLPDGSGFIGVGGTWVRRWTYPEATLAAEFLLPEQGTLATGYSGLVTERAVLVAVEDLLEAGEWYLLQLDPDSLRPVCAWELPLSTEAVTSVHLLPGGFILSPEDGQLWRLPDEVLSAR